MIRAKTFLISSLVLTVSGAASSQDSICLGYSCPDDGFSTNDWEGIYTQLGQTDQLMFQQSFGLTGLDEDDPVKACMDACNMNYRANLTLCSQMYPSESIFGDLNNISLTQCYDAARQKQEQCLWSDPLMNCLPN